MSRMWFAVIFLAIATFLCAYEQKTVTETFENLNTILDSITADVAENNYEDAEKMSRHLENIWDTQYPKLTAMSDHGALDDAALSIGSIKGLAKEKSDDLLPAVSEAKQQIKILYDHSKVTVGNVF